MQMHVGGHNTIMSVEYLYRFHETNLVTTNSALILE